MIKTLKENLNIAIASDHAGVSMKEFIIKSLQTSTCNFIDLGPFCEKSVDYPDFAKKVVHSILNKSANYGILICGTGIGMSIAANRYVGIQAALACNPEYASLSRIHNNANILCLGARFITQEKALECVKSFLTSSFEEGRHLKRLQKINDLS